MFLQLYSLHIKNMSLVDWAKKIHKPQRYKLESERYHAVGTYMPLDVNDVRKHYIYAYNLFSGILIISGMILILFGSF